MWHTEALRQVPAAFPTLFSRASTPSAAVSGKYGKEPEDKAVVVVPYLIGVEVRKGSNCSDIAVRYDYCIQCWHTVWFAPFHVLVSCVSAAD